MTVSHDMTRPATRVVVDQDGSRWTVHERAVTLTGDAASGDSADAAPLVALHFTAGDAHRRLWGYSPTWHELPEDELLVLLMRATPVLAER